MRTSCLLALIVPCSARGKKRQRQRRQLNCCAGRPWGERPVRRPTFTSSARASSLVRAQSKQTHRHTHAHIWAKLSERFCKPPAQLPAISTHSPCSRSVCRVSARLRAYTYVRQREHARKNRKLHTSWRTRRENASTIHSTVSLVHVKSESNASLGFILYMHLLVFLMLACCLIVLYTITFVHYAFWCAECSAIILCNTQTAHYWRHKNGVHEECSSARKLHGTAVRSRIHRVMYNIKCIHSHMFTYIVHSIHSLSRDDLITNQICIANARSLLERGLSLSLYGVALAGSTNRF